MFLHRTNTTNEQTKWLLKGFHFDDELNREIRTTVTNMKYNDFLETTYWKTITSIVKDDSDNKCKECGSEQDLEVHHKKYYSYIESVNY